MVSRLNRACFPEWLLARDAPPTAAGASTSSSTGWDAYRIARDLALPMESFVELQGAAEPDAAHQLVLDSAATSDRYRRATLLKRDGACPFLMSIGSPIGGVGRCGIYPIRPSPCRAYPATFDDELLQLAPREYCPPGAWDQLDQPRFRGYYRFGQRQRAIHDVLGDGWNERVLKRRERHSPSDLYAYWMDSYGRLEKRVPEWFGDPPLVLSEDEVREVVSTVLEEMSWL